MNVRGKSDELVDRERKGNDEEGWWKGNGEKVVGRKEDKRERSAVEEELESGWRKADEVKAYTDLLKRSPTALPVGTLVPCGNLPPQKTDKLISGRCSSKDFATKDFLLTILFSSWKHQNIPLSTMEIPGDPCASYHYVQITSTKLITKVLQP